jgi:hypothetical protein
LIVFSKVKKLGDWAIGRLGDWAIGRLGDWAIGGLGDVDLGCGMWATMSCKFPGEMKIICWKAGIFLKNAD